VKVSLVATVKDAAPFAREFVTSLEGQTRAPDEIVIVDGGSTDGTVPVLRSSPAITVIEAPGANIPMGRNIAIRAATHEVIAVTDADCVLAPDWLERILEPLETGADVAMGLYRPLTSSFFEVCAAAISIKEREEIRPERYLPSARSIAFRREAFETAGRYPEWLSIGEDMLLNHRWRALGVRMELAERAVVYRRPRSDLPSYVRQFFRYAEGDALGGMHAQRHGLRFAVYGALAGALAARGRAPKLLAAVTGAAYAAKPIRRAFRLLPPGSPQRAVAVVAVPALQAVTDLAKMAGYAAGRISRRSHPVPRMGEDTAS
jgi:glycosyltransferase involved in cell wall biosynthesis